MSAYIYPARQAKQSPTLNGLWDAPAWQEAETVEVAYFYPQSSDHHPRTLARLLYDETGLHGIFQVQDQYVRCLHTGFQEPVYQDACVEFFIKPRETSGYFNFEMNCGGGLLCYYIVDPTPAGSGYADYSRLTPDDARLVKIYHSLAGPIDPEITEPVEWTLQFHIPFTLIEKYAGPVGEAAGQTWRGNFYKCAENNSHPHWASWAPLPELRFHNPGYFGEIRFNG